MSNISTKILIYSVFFVVLFCSPVLSQTIVRVSADNSVIADRLALGDIAEISGDVERVEKLKKISLGYAPNVGLTREIPKEKIVLAISASGISSDEYLLESPDLSRVRRIGQTVSQDLLREAVEKAVLPQFELNKIEAKVVRLDLPAAFEVPQGDVQVKANFSSHQNLFAPFTVSIEIKLNQQIVKRVTATAQVEAFAEVLTAAKDLPAQSKLNETDFQLGKRRLQKSLTAYLRDTKKLRGAVLLKNIKAGDEITTSDFTAGIVIKVGDTVRIVGQSGKLQISINGEARANGKIGDRIAVKNLQSGVIIQAIVLDEHNVAVNF